MPLLNKGVQYIERKFTDDPALGGLDIALKTVVNEYAKIVSGSMGNTATAEGAPGYPHRGRGLEHGQPGDRGPRGSRGDHAL